MRTLICALSCLLLASTAVHATESISPSPQQISEYEASSEKTRINLLIRLANAGQHELAASLLQRYPLTGNFAANRTLFIEGLILKARGDLTSAAKNFRAALANDPGLTLVRAELAQTLVLLQEDESAIHHLNLLMAEAPNEAAAQGVRSFIDTIDARSPFKFNGYISAAPSTNINNGGTVKTIYDPVTNKVVTYRPDALKQSGIGFAGGLNAGYSKRLGNKFSLVLGGGVDLRLYDDSDYNSYTASQSAELRHLIDEGYVGLGIVASESMKTDQLGLSYYSYGPRVSLQKAFTAKDRLNVSTVYEWRKYTDNPIGNGEALMVNGSWDHAFSADFAASLDAGFDRLDTEITYNSYSAYSVGLGLYRELPMGITANLHGGVQLSKFDGIFPIINIDREDKRYSGSVTITKRDFNWWGYAPGFTYSYVQNDSNIPLYDFNSHAIEFKLSKDF